MPRKKWTVQTAITPALVKLREKRKWQITLRRYVLEKNPSIHYAPYFGLDIESMRSWFETQFEEGLGWDDFGKSWQFDHIIPVNCFDFSKEEELKLCWNFINIRVDIFKNSKDSGNRLDILAAKTHFKALYTATLFKPCLGLLEKIDKLERTEIVNTEKQVAFIKGKQPLLDLIENYAAFEFELLNSGRSVEEVVKEVAFLKKF